MNTVDIHRGCTSAELLQMPDSSGYELVDGRLVDILHDALDGWITCRVSTELLTFVQEQKAGIVLGSKAQYQCFPQHPHRIRKPDVSFIDNSKLAEGFFTADYIQAVPDLVIEVISAHERYREVEAKLQDYLSAGVRLIWVFNPDMKSVRVHRLNGQLSEVECTGDLDGEEVLPGFNMAITPLFEMPAMANG